MNKVLSWISLLFALSITLSTWYYVLFVNWNLDLFIIWFPLGILLIGLCIASIWLIKIEYKGENK